MPAMSVVAFPAIVARAGVGAVSPYVVSPEDCTITVQQMPSGGLHVRLPGTSSPVPPGDGDFYIIADPLGLITSANPLTVEGNGYTMNGAATQVVTATNGWLAVQFDAENKVWVVFRGDIA